MNDTVTKVKNAPSALGFALASSAGVEVGGIFEIGYTINRNFSVDLRFNQRVLNLLNQDVVAVTSMTGMKLLASHVTLGFSLYL